MVEGELMKWTRAQMDRLELLYYWIYRVYANKVGKDTYLHIKMMSTLWWYLYWPLESSSSLQSNPHLKLRQQKHLTGAPIKVSVVVGPNDFLGEQVLFSRRRMVGRPRVGQLHICMKCRRRYINLSIVFNSPFCPGDNNQITISCFLLRQKSMLPMCKKDSP